MKSKSRYIFGLFLCVIAGAIGGHEGLLSLAAVLLGMVAINIIYLA